MTSSEKILAGIMEEGKKAVDDIIKDAEGKAAVIAEKAKTDAQSEAKAIIDEAEKKAQIIKNNGISSSALIKRDKALTFRREAINGILEEVVKTICEYNDCDYFSFLSDIVAKSVLPQSGELMLSKKDLERDTGSFKNKIKEYNLTLSENPIDINGGFILKYGDIQINGELNAIIREKREELVDCINNALFN